jgi:hypothetical protein
MTIVFFDVVFTVPGMSIGEAPWRAGARAVAVVVWNLSNETFGVRCSAHPSGNAGMQACGRGCGRGCLRCQDKPVCKTENVWPLREFIL